MGAWNRNRIGLARAVVTAAAIALAVVSILGTVGARGSGVPATSVTLNLPTAAVPLPGGGFLIADSKDNVVRRVNASGEITIVAGNGQDNATGGDPNTHGDGGVATAAELDDPTDAVPTPDGGFLIADASNNLTGADGGGGAVRKVSAHGVITTIAGGPRLSGGNYQGICLGKTDAIGDGCPATQAVLGNPTSAAQTSDGSILIADGGLGLVRRISGGTITSVAGGGSGSCVGATDTFGDNCPATDAILGFPTAAIPLNIAGAAVNTPGTGYLIADEENCLVHYVDGSGVMHLAAGNPTNLCTADPTSASGPATAVGLNQPSDVRPTAGGGFLIADAGNCRVLKVSSVLSGSVTTVEPPAAGCSFSTTFTSLFLNRAFTAAIPTPDGGFLATSGNSTVEHVSSTGAVTTVAGGHSKPSPPRCSLTVTSTRIALKQHKTKKHHAGAPVGKLQLSARCNEAARISVGGTLTEKTGKRKHGKSVTRSFRLGPVSASVKANHKVSLLVKLPSGAVTGLARKLPESAKLTLTAQASSGTSHQQTSIGKLSGSS